MEDPWANLLQPYDSEQTLNNAPNLRIINAAENKWLSDGDLRVMLVGVLETRRQKQEDAVEGSSVRSTMLEDGHLIQMGLYWKKSHPPFPAG